MGAEIHRIEREEDMDSDRDRDDREFEHSIGDIHFGFTAEFYPMRDFGMRDQMGITCLFCFKGKREDRSKLRDDRRNPDGMRCFSMKALKMIIDEIVKISDEWDADILAYGLFSESNERDREKENSYIKIMKRYGFTAERNCEFVSFRREPR